VAVSGSVHGDRRPSPCPVFSTKVSVLVGSPIFIPIMSSSVIGTSVKTPAKDISMNSNTYPTFYAMTAGHVSDRHTPLESHFMWYLRRRWLNTFYKSNT